MVERGEWGGGGGGGKGKEEKRRGVRECTSDISLSLHMAGLMISAFAYASQVLDSPGYLEQAVKAAQFVRTHLFKEDSGLLLRNAYRDSTG